MIDLGIEDALRERGHFVGYNGRTKCPKCGATKRRPFSFTGHIFNCFACGLKGSTVDLVAALENIDRAAAIKLLTRDQRRQTPREIAEQRRRQRQRELARGVAESARLAKHAVWVEALERFSDALADCRLVERILDRDRDERSAVTRGAAAELSDLYLRRDVAEWELEMESREWPRLAV